MNTQNKTETRKAVLNAKTERAEWIRDRATRCAISQGYSKETAEAFAQWALAYCPEMQGFTNLFDHYMNMRTDGML